MTLSSASLVRQRIQDFPQPIDDTYYGDGTATRYKFAYTNLVSATAYVAPGGTAWSATAGATFNVSGYLDFTDRVSANSAFRVVGVQSVWSDEAIGDYLTAEGSVLGAALQCAYDLQFDNVKRSRWMAANGAQYDNMQAGAYVKDIISAIKEEMREDAVSDGAMTSWAETNGDY